MSILNKTETIGWSIVPSDATIIWSDPIKISTFDSNKKSFDFCPAHTQHSNQLYHILSPYDIEINFDSSKKYFSQINSNIPEDRIFSGMYDDGIIKIMPEQFWHNNNPVLQINTPYVFFSDNKDASIELYPSIRYDNNFPGYMINGSFDIYNWIRTLNFGLYWENNTKNFILKKNNPMFTFKVTGVGNYKLKYIPWNKDIENMYLQVKNITRHVKNPFSYIKNLLNRRVNKLVK
jgi:hypothetical protein